LARHEESQDTSHDQEPIPHDVAHVPDHRCVIGEAPLNLVVVGASDQGDTGSHQQREEILTGNQTSRVDH
jgi:hypothetical protein